MKVLALRARTLEFSDEPLTPATCGALLRAADRVNRFATSVGPRHPLMH
jgi:hypothetical protein